MLVVSVKDGKTTKIRETPHVNRVLVLKDGEAANVRNTLHVKGCSFEKVDPAPDETISLF